MQDRLRVIISAYLCLPDKGSEQEVGWQWALGMARLHDVNVVTRANNRAPIEAALAKVAPEHQPRFEYFDLSPFWLRLKRLTRLHRCYYWLWQRAAHALIAKKIQAGEVDLLHHVQYTGCRYSAAAVCGHSVPVIWGPVAGLESTPVRLLPFRYPAPLMEEVIRNLGNWWNAIWTVPRTAKGATLSLVATRESDAAFRAKGIASRLFPFIGITASDVPVRVPDAAPVLRLLYAGRLIWWKGLEFCLLALAKADVHAKLTIIGKGSFEPRARQLVQELGIAEKVEFRGVIPRDKLLASYKEFDVLLFPSIHDTGGFVAVEAMANSLPVICLDAGGPGLIVTDDCGIRVPLGTRDQVSTGIAEAIGRYATTPELVREHGSNARRRIEEHFDWSGQASRMDTIYRELVRK